MVCMVVSRITFIGYTHYQKFGKPNNLNVFGSPKSAKGKYTLV